MSDTNAAGQTFLMGGVNAFNINFNAGGLGPTIGVPTELNTFSGFSPTFAGFFTSGDNVDVFGTFNLNGTNSAGFTNSATKITFTLTDNVGTWSSAANVVTPNASGFEAAISGFECPSGCTGTSTALATGSAAGSVVS